MRYRRAARRGSRARRATGSRRRRARPAGRFIAERHDDRHDRRKLANCPGPNSRPASTSCGHRAVCVLIQFASRPLPRQAPIYSTLPLSSGRAGEVHPGTFVPAFDPGFGELDAFGAFAQVVGEGLIGDDMLAGTAPTATLKPLSKTWLVGHCHPAVVEVDRAVDVRVPDRARRARRRAGSRSRAGRRRRCLWCRPLAGSAGRRGARARTRRS